MQTDAGAVEDGARDTSGQGNMAIAHAAHSGRQACSGSGEKMRIVKFLVIAILFVPVWLIVLASEWCDQIWDDLHT